MPKHPETIKSEDEPDELAVDVALLAGATWVWVKFIILQGPEPAPALQNAKCVGSILEICMYMCLIQLEYFCRACKVLLR